LCWTSLFTVYGPWGRPDMAPFLFVKAAFEDQPIKVFNYGNQSRDFTYVTDIVSGIELMADKIESMTGNHIYNIGCGNPVPLMDFIGTIERHVGKKCNAIYYQRKTEMLVKRMLQLRNLLLLATNQNMV